MTVYTISTGQTSSGLTLNTGDDLFVRMGGTATNTIVNSGAAEVIDVGSANQTTVNDGGAEYLVAGADSLTTVTSGGRFEVLGGTDKSALIASGGVQDVYGGLVTLADILATGSQVVLGGGVNSATVAGLQTVAGGTVSATTVAAGGAQVVAAGLVVSTVVDGGGTQTVDGGGVSATVVNGGGSQTVSSGGFAAGTLVQSGGRQVLVAGGNESGTTLQAGASLDLSFLAFGSGGSASIDPGSDFLSVTENGVTVVESLAGNYAGRTVLLSDDGHGGTLATIACYCRGTAILTTDGEVAVEALRVGQLLVTAAGQARPVKWIGTRSYHGRFAAGNKGVLPVVIRAGALAAGVPHRDLRVSPKHAMLLDGVLVPAAELVNGTTIVQPESSGQIDYFHVELETHDVIVAEGAASETFVDDGNRGMFHNAGQYTASFPGNAPVSALYCAPRVSDGFTLDAIRRRLAPARRAEAA